MNVYQEQAKKETESINQLKQEIRDIVIGSGHYSGMEKSTHIAVYALLELAAEVAWIPSMNKSSFFIDAAREVDDVFSANPSRFLDY